MANKLDIGDRIPDLSLQCVDGSTLDLPNPGGAKYQVILFYRGHW
jgi:peroxiredoxin